MKLWILYASEATDAHCEVIFGSEIVGVFSSKEKAEEAREQLPERGFRERSEYYIDEYVLDTSSHHH